MYPTGMTKLTGAARKAMYGIWYMMHERCTNRKHPYYFNYGGKGVTVCKRWDSFDAFVADVGPRPSAAHTLERKDGNKGYSPSNVRWATRKEQAANTLNCVELTHNGETRIMSDWAQVTGLRVHLISQRLSNGWSVERTLTEKPRSKPKNVLIEFDGKKKTAAEWSKIRGVPAHRILTRLRQGYTAADAITTPIRGRPSRPSRPGGCVSSPPSRS